MRKTLCFLIAWLLMPAFAAIQDPVKLDTGLVSGIDATVSGIRVYKGIPFAAPPVGESRWRAPQPAPHWDGVRVADQYGASCTQAGGPNQKTSEDCLYLNVWTAAKSAGDKLPVMLWLYGGGNYVGSGSSAQYDGGIAKKGAVIVTFNYRVGPFGFFAHPALTKESGHNASGNYGMMDAIAALQWIRRNIAGFGGDPNRVTLFGESAGSQDIANLMASPQAKGLFHRVIGQSSSFTTVRISKLAPLSETEQAGLKLAAGKSLAELRAMPAADVLKWGNGSGVIVDGWLLPEDPVSVFAKGKQNDVPLLVGSNKDEGNFFIAQPAPAAVFAEQSRARFGNLADAFLKLYPAGSDAEADTSQFAAARDEVAWVMRKWAELQAKTGKSNAYVYYFTHEPPEQGNTKNGRNNRATHGAEIPYAYQSLAGNRPWTDIDRQVADLMSSYWVNFAAKGDPNGKDLPKWPAFDGKKNIGRMILGDKVEFGPGLDDSRVAFYQSVFDQRYKP